MIAVPMDRRREAQQESHTHARPAPLLLFRLARKTGIGWILFRCERASALKEQGPGSDDQHALEPRGRLPVSR